VANSTNGIVDQYLRFNHAFSLLVCYFVSPRIDRQPVWRRRSAVCGASSLHIRMVVTFDFFRDCTTIVDEKCWVEIQRLAKTATAKMLGKELLSTASK
jgi:hypothetical protein